MKEIKVSLVLLTWNRWKSVYESLSANLKSAGYPIYELVHVDNGSDEEFLKNFNREFCPDVQVLHAHNLGVAVGYNRGFALSSGTHVCLTGCDRVMPENWLAHWVEALQKIENTACVACYTYDEPGRHHKEHGGAVPSEIRNGVTIQRAIPVEARIHSKEFLFKAGFWREDFGLYGYEDSEWSDRANMTANKNGLINYILPNMGYAKHLEDNDFPKLIEGLPYKEYKHKIHTDPRRAALFKWCWQNKSPYYNPYYQVEPNRLEEMK